ncbi:Spy/CpxP family protein refolding chaperone [Kangiella sp. M94]
MLFNKALSALAIGASLMMFNVSADARNHGEMHDNHSMKQHHMMMEKLGVNDEQRTKIDKLYEQRKETFKAHQEQMQELMQQQRHMMQQDTLDKAKLQNNLRKQADIKAEMMAGRHQHYMEVQKHLNEEQRAKMKELREEMYEMREDMREKARERGKDNRG